MRSFGPIRLDHHRRLSTTTNTNIISSASSHRSMTRPLRRGIVLAKPKPKQFDSLPIDPRPRTHDPNRATIINLADRLPPHRFQFARLLTSRSESGRHRRGGVDFDLPERDERVPRVDGPAGEERRGRTRVGKEEDLFVVRDREGRARGAEIVDRFGSRLSTRRRRRRGRRRPRRIRTARTQFGMSRHFSESERVPEGVSVRDCSGEEGFGSIHARADPAPPADKGPDRLRFAAPIMGTEPERVRPACLCVFGSGASERYERLFSQVFGLVSQRVPKDVENSPSSSLSPDMSIMNSLSRQTQYGLHGNVCGLNGLGLLNGTGQSQ